MVKRFRGLLYRGYVGSAALAVMAVTLASNAVLAAESVTIPDMPVDFGAIASSAASVLGTVVAGVIGIFVIVALINMGIKWVRRALVS